MPASIWITRSSSERSFRLSWKKRGKRGTKVSTISGSALQAGRRGIEVWTSTLKEAPAFPRVGDLVGFRIVTIASDLPPGMNLIGFIAFQFEPVLAKDKGWRIARNLTPADIKPELHL
jgi:hypothetical protein